MPPLVAAARACPVPPLVLIVAPALSHGRRHGHTGVRGYGRRGSMCPLSPAFSCPRARPRSGFHWPLGLTFPRPPDRLWPARSGPLTRLVLNARSVKAPDGASRSHPLPRRAIGANPCTHRNNTVAPCRPASHRTVSQTYKRSAPLACLPVARRPESAPHRLGL
jgi:hypothetical protein